MVRALLSPGTRGNWSSLLLNAAIVLWFLLLFHIVLIPPCLSCFLIQLILSTVAQSVFFFLLFQKQNLILVQVVLHSLLNISCWHSSSSLLIGFIVFSVWTDHILFVYSSIAGLLVCFNFISNIAKDLQFAFGISERVSQRNDESAPFHDRNCYMLKVVEPIYSLPGVYECFHFPTSSQYLDEIFANLMGVRRIAFNYF